MLRLKSNTKGSVWKHTFPESSRQPHKNIAAAINSVKLPASVPPLVTAGEDLAELKHKTAPHQT